MRFLIRCAAVVVAAAALVVAVVPQATPAASTPIVTAVNIRGNAHVPTDKIGAVVKTRPGVPLDTKQIAADQSAILSLGYFSDVKTDVRATPGGVGVTFIVIENPVVSKIVFDGNTHVTSDILTALMDTSAGEVLNTNTLRDDVAKINSYYDKLGYTGTRHVKNIHIDPDGKLSLDVKEGVTISKIDITGNKIINTPGDPRRDEDEARRDLLAAAVRRRPAGHPDAVQGSRLLRGRRRQRGPEQRGRAHRDDLRIARRRGGDPRQLEDQGLRHPAPAAAQARRSRHRRALAPRLRGDQQHAVLQERRPRAQSRSATSAAM